MKTRTILFALVSVLFTAGNALAAHQCRGWHYEGSRGEPCYTGTGGVPICQEPRVVWEPGVQCYPTSYGIMACECPDSAPRVHHHRR